MLTRIKSDFAINEKVEDCPDDGRDSQRNQFTKTN
jgi:hypothetical protein